MNRRQMAVILDKNRQWMHFNKYLQRAAGQEVVSAKYPQVIKLTDDRDLWFRVHGDLFQCVEDVLVKHGVATTVANVTPRPGVPGNYIVEYNPHPAQAILGD